MSAYCDTIHIFCFFWHTLTHAKLILGGISSTSFTQYAAEHEELT